jgi:hypothetical protein
VWRGKHNVSFQNAERNYHVPGQAYYDVTRINEAYGQQWVCTEDKSVKAG